MHDNRGVSEGVTKSKHLPDYTYRNNKEFITIEELATPGDYYIDSLEGSLLVILSWSFW